jgi:aminodeoxyfutalosine synthase
MSSSPIFRIAEKVHARERLTFEDGVALFETEHLALLGHLADTVRRARHGDVAYYNVNRHLNPTNVCYWDCTFCSFYRKPGEEGAYTYTVAQAIDEIRPSYEAGITEIHIVGGLHPTLKFDYYLDLLRGLKAAFPDIHLKAFTMVELDHFKRITRLSESEVLDRLLEAGLDSCPGGGAEIFAEPIREKICKHKCDGDRWLTFAKIVHQKGLRSNATMLYGHIESYADRVDHLLRLRELQDETGGFQCFIPLAFYPESTELAHLPGPTAIDSLKTVAVSRLMLDNFDHIKAYWVMLGRQTAQFALHFGADDLDGTVSGGGPLVATYSADGANRCQTTRDEVVKLIVDAGLQPVERDTLYRPVVRPVGERESLSV